MRRLCAPTVDSVELHLLTQPVPTMTPASPKKVIFDTDPGVDDAMALYYALAHPAINALYLCALAGRSIPVTLGASHPLFKNAESPPAFIHGADGLGNLPQRSPTTGRTDPRSSAQFIVDTVRANPGDITLVAVGPLGNLALALQLAPELPTLVREVVLMGGTVQELKTVVD